MSSPESPIVSAPVAPPALGSSMTEWTIRLERQGMGEAARGVDANRAAELAMLAALGLPHYRRLEVPAADALYDAASLLASMPRDGYFTILSPNKPGSERFRQYVTTAADLAAFIVSRLGNQPADYTAIIQENFEHKYGGNIVCLPGGEVYGEVMPGQLGHNLVVSGQSRPQEHITLHKDIFTDRFGYSTDNVSLREGLWRTLQCLPRGTTDDHAPEYAQRAPFVPGYYEFFLVQRTPGAPLEPIFNGYSAQPAFVNLPADRLSS